MGESDRLSKIITLNIENFHTNKLYLNELMDTHEIICNCLQEHWLYNFEQSTLDDFGAENNFDSYIKSTDDSDPLSPLQRPRGKGGVATLWRENISKNIHITKTRPCNILQYFTDVNLNFQMKKCDIFVIFSQNIDCEYTLEPPH